MGTGGPKFSAKGLAVIAGFILLFAGTGLALAGFRLRLLGVALPSMIPAWLGYRLLRLAWER